VPKRLSPPSGESCHVRWRGTLPRADTQTKEPPPPAKSLHRYFRRLPFSLCCGRESSPPARARLFSTVRHGLSARRWGRRLRLRGVPAGCRLLGAGEGRGGRTGEAGRDRPGCPVHSSETASRNGGWRRPTCTLPGAACERMLSRRWQYGHELWPRRRGWWAAEVWAGMAAVGRPGAGALGTAASRRCGRVMVMATAR
jgi:hypothetical protein